MMRRLLLLVLTISALIAIIWYSNYADKDEAGSVHSLKNGGEVHLLAVTYGKTHTVSLEPPVTWRTRIQLAREQRSLGPIFNPPAPKSTSSISKPSECLCLWFSIRSKTNPLNPEDAELILPNNQRFHIRSGGFSFDSNGRAILHQVLPVIPTRDRYLRFVGKFGGETVTFEFKNPVSGTRPSKWKAEGLPQTKTISGVSLTLGSVTLAPEYNSGGGSWMPRFRFSVLDQGTKANQWYSIKRLIEDQSGNSFNDMALLSEPVWRVRATLTRNKTYPRKGYQIQWLGPVDRWLGTIDPARAGALADNAYELFALPDSPGTIRLAGIFGKGEFDLTANGKVNKPTFSPEKPTSVSYDSFDKVWKLSLSSPSFVLWTQQDNPEEADLAYVLRTLDDKPFFMPSRASSGTTRGTVSVYGLPPEPVRIGIIPRRLEFEFYVKPPTIPAPIQQTDR